ncbi:MAG: tetratricopeptide repeat protein, partial [Nitrospinaceae bacterium]|nr:tetratricopeptide repeat protein [Nitrospinaceae bacterium]NIR53764.1 tetratricopeptide repeat protein [Nitrospinaceae bacterium]NIS84173.1 tetratricopeptide repeat protein [Nitrospinaceae bacterium]NIT80979.1 tetratricopeptide repeat protein [Nitrospinaceae bacterium]NIU43269.1 tetratricopeptide repeat protein [Nitrospinaceae bacterium]
EKSAEAEPLFKRALSIRENTFGPDHPEVSDLLHNLSEMYGKMGNPSLAVPLCQRALVIRENSLGSDHPRVADSLANLG